MEFNGQVVIVTGAGGGLGRIYALQFAQRGASVVVNDLGVSRSGDSGSGSGQKAADIVVEEIRKIGGKAVANYDSVDNGERIVQTAIDAFGRIDVVVNNAGILRDKTFSRMTDQDWDLVQSVHLRGSYKVAKAAWPHFVKQKYGRVINTASAAGIYGNYGQANYSAAKLALHGFSMCLAREGERNGIKANTIAPLAASRMTESVLPQEILQNLKPEFVAPLVLLLAHRDSPDSGALFEVGAGYVAKLRWERSCGVVFRTDDSFTAGAVQQKFAQINDFSSGAQYPQSVMDVDWMAVLEQAKQLPSQPSPQPPLRFDGRVVVITGAGGGIGRAYALHFGRLGASVVVNDLGTSATGQGVGRAADVVVEEIRSAGGKAVANYDSVEEGEKLIETAIKSFGRVDIIVNNAGILRDKSFSRMTDQDWDLVQRVHLRGTFKVCKAAWPYFLKQKYGRIINTASAVGLYGNFGQANYSAAKIGIIGLGNTLAIEGAKNNILVNTIAPNAGTRMTATVMPPEMVEALKPEYVAPLVAWLAHEQNQASAGIFEVGSGWVSRVRWQRAGGAGFPVDRPLQPEQIAQQWPAVAGFDDGRATYPATAQESFQAVFENFSRSQPSSVASSSKTSDSKSFPAMQFTYTERDVVLYNLGVGAKRSDLPLVYENHDQFMALPTFGVIPAFPIMFQFPMQDVLGSFNPMMLLHGEQYMELYRPIPTRGSLTNEIKVVDVQDKAGKGVVLVLGVWSRDSASGQPVVYNEYSNFIRGIQWKGGKIADGGRPAIATASYTAPDRVPDSLVTEKTTEEQAVLYRLSGDLNPLHVDPEMSSMGGFKVPILHGLCTFGIAVKHVVQVFGGQDPSSAVRSVKARFAKHVFPGETLQTEMWREADGRRIIFQVRVKERNVLAITNAAVELNRPGDVGSLSPAVSHASQESGQQSLMKPVAGFKSSAVFQQLFAAFQARSESDREAQIKKTNAIFQFDIKNDKGQVQSWFIDLKKSGTVGLGVTKNGADVVILISDNDFMELAGGRMSGQKAFMSGKIKIKGKMMLATKLDGLLKDAAKGAKL